ncbi:MAG: PIG-L family deacetylase [Promethearchaeota archaeon]|nr:MAG: PIG-L family deacetylase [Candidatus Lokiarchaeota archaeon]
MKIVIFEPHPDDLLFGTGHIIFDWINQGHDIHVITITDGRACLRKTPELASKISEDQMAEMRTNEAKKAIEFLGLNQENLHLLYFPDGDGQKYVNEAIEKVKPLIQDADRLFLPSDNNLHVDHQATHDIAKRAAKELNLKNIEYWVYFVPQYGRFDEDSAENLVEIELSEEKRKKLQEWLQIYQSQKLIKMTWKLYTRYLKYTKKMKYAIYTFEDMGKYHNF